MNEKKWKEKKNLWKIDWVPSGNKSGCPSLVSFLLILSDQKPVNYFGIKVTEAFFYFPRIHIENIACYDHKYFKTTWQT